MPFAVEPRLQTPDQAHSFNRLPKNYYVDDNSELLLQLPPCARPEKASQFPQKSHVRIGIVENAYVNLVMEIKKDGSFKIVKVTQISGQVILQDAPTSEFIYEVTAGRKTLATAFFPEDPFIVRGFADPKEGQELSYDATIAVIVINFPLSNTSSGAISKIGLRILKLVPGTIIDRIDSMILNELRDQHKLIVLNDFPANKLGPAIKKNLKKLRE